MTPDVMRYKTETFESEGFCYDTFCAVYLFQMMLLLVD